MTSTERPELDWFDRLDRGRADRLIEECELAETFSRDDRAELRTVRSDGSETARTDQIEPITNTPGGENDLPLTDALDIEVRREGGQGGALQAGEEANPRQESNASHKLAPGRPRPPCPSGAGAGPGRAASPGPPRASEPT